MTGAALRSSSGAPGALRSTPPPPPQRNPPSAPASAVVASPSVVPRAPATPPPPPPQRPTLPPSFARPSTPVASGAITAQLEQRLGATQVELRKLGSERHTLRARLRREADRLRELESALRAEKELRGQASDEHFASIVGLRTRLAELEAERDAAVSQQRTAQQLLRTELEQARAELEQARSRVAESDAPAPSKASKVPQGLRRIRGIGPAYQRELEQSGITRVQQIASWTELDILAFAEKLKIRPERITKDDWVGQAKSLDPDD